MGNLRDDTRPGRRGESRSSPPSGAGRDRWKVLPPGSVLLATILLLILTAVLPAAGSPQGARSTASSAVVTPRLYLPVVAQARYENGLPDPITTSGLVEPFGVQVFGLVDSLGLPQATDAGIRWMRAGFFWSKVEPTPTVPATYDWSHYDEGFGRLAQRGVGIIAVVGNNPPWAAVTKCGPIDADHLSDFVAFVRAAVARYSYAPYYVRHWEFFNEPDNVDPRLGENLGGCWGGHSREYAQMLRLVYAAVKEANPRAQVVLGGLAYDWFVDQNGYFERGFLDGVLQEEYSGGNRIFDVMNFHYYPLFAPNWQAWGTDVIGKARYLRQRLTWFLADRPMIITEIGRPLGARPGGDEEAQSRYLPQAFARAMAADLRIAIWYSLVDDGSQFDWGLLGPNLEPRLAYRAYRVLTAEMKQPIYLGTFDAAGVEGYRFHTMGNQQKVLLWASDSGRHSVSFRARQVRVASLYGDRSTTADGDDGVVDGLCQVWVGQDPVYIEIVN